MATNQYRQTDHQNNHGYFATDQSINTKKQLVRYWGYFTTDQPIQTDRPLKQSRIFCHRPTNTGTKDHRPINADRQLRIFHHRPINTQYTYKTTWSKIKNSLPQTNQSRQTIKNISPAEKQAGPLPVVCCKLACKLKTAISAAIF